MLLNAGGVTVSYFEWLKNLEHQRLGRMTKRWEEKMKAAMYEQIQASNPSFNKDYAKWQAIQNGEPAASGSLNRAAFEGASEEDVVHSALQETMTTACDNVIDAAHARDVSYRMGGFMVAINRIQRSYESGGILITG